MRPSDPISDLIVFMPSTLSELIEDIRRERAALNTLLANVPESRMSEPGVVGDWSVKDMLAHLGVWLARAITMLFQAERNGKPIPPHVMLKTDNWDKVNAADHALQKDRPLDRVLADFHETHAQVLKRLERLDAGAAAALFDARRYPSLEGKTLAYYVWSDAAEHDAEHRIQIEAWLARSEPQA
jgi:hypothetical protein